MTSLDKELFDKAKRAANKILSEQANWLAARINRAEAEVGGQPGTVMVELLTLGALELGHSLTAKAALENVRKTQVPEVYRYMVALYGYAKHGGPDRTVFEVRAPDPKGGKPGLN